MKKVKVEEAVGMVLAHDITEIVPGRRKVVAFQRGKRIEKEDVERLLDLGKKHIYILESDEEGIHEEEAALRIAKALMDENMEILPPKEGKVSIISKVDGLFYVDKGGLQKVNMVKDVLFSTLPNRYPVKRGDVVAATRILPLYIDEKYLKKVEGIKKKVIWISPYTKKKIGIVVTGSEIYNGRIQDGSMIVEEKLRQMRCEIVGKRIVDDEISMIRDSILDLMNMGADIVVTTGGLSVDPDDVTKEGIEATGARVIFYGTPVFPGAMFLLGFLDGKYILGAPACIYYNRYTVFDIILGRILAGENLESMKKSHVASLAYGGLCLGCNPCHYPACFFGKAT